MAKFKEALQLPCLLSSFPLGFIAPYPRAYTSPAVTFVAKKKLAAGDARVAWWAI